MKFANLLIIIALIVCSGCSSDSGIQTGSENTYETSSNTAVYYKPPVLPITLSYDRNGFGISLDASVVTPIGTFGIKHTQKIKSAQRPYTISTSYASKNPSQLHDHYRYRNLRTNVTNSKLIHLLEDDLLVIIKKKDGTSDLFKIKNNSKLKLNLNGESEITIERNYIEINISRGDVSVIELINMGKNEAASSYPSNYSNSAHSTQQSYSPPNQTPRSYSAPRDAEEMRSKQGYEIPASKKEIRQEKKARIREFKKAKKAAKKERKTQKKAAKKEKKMKRKQNKKDRKKRRN